MALIDRYLEAMAKQKAEAVIFKTGAVPEMVVGGVPRAVSKQTASLEQILSLLSEVLGAGFERGLLPGTPAEFPYTSPNVGAVKINVLQVDSAKMHARIQLAPAGASASPDNVGDYFAGMNVAPPGAAAPAPAPSPAAAKLGANSSIQVGSVRDSPQGTPAHIDELFAQMVEFKASDLHLKGGKPPMLRVDGEIRTIPGRPPLEPQALEGLVRAIMPPANLDEFRDTNDTDFAYELPGKARFRCNVFRDLAGMGAVFRQIPTKILTVQDLRLPKAVVDLCELEKGLVVVTGPTGSGKSTTLAAMIDYINASRTDHIITIEDPVEFVHPDKSCLINQREVGKMTKGFKAALRAALREDPDIVLVGEMRDLETVAIAIETAETGHLVFGTLHTNTAASTVDRIIDQFPADRQSQIRTMLSESLKGVVAQTLLRKKGGGRVAALEILIVNSAIANLIREGKTFQINSMIQTGRGLGMQTLSDAILDLVKNNIVEPQEGYDRSPNKKEFGQILTRAGFKGPWSEPGADKA